jgi:hypothetical protein
MAPYTLREIALKDDDAWNFTVPQNALRIISSKRSGVYGKLISFSKNSETSTTSVTLQIQKFPENRIIRSDDSSKFVLVSFGVDSLRWPDTTLRATADYISRLMKAGLFLNDVQYRFYHHSNNQLVGSMISKLCTFLHHYRRVDRVLCDRQTQTPNWTIGSINLEISGAS